jgi:hypothetical protein
VAHAAVAGAPEPGPAGILPQAALNSSNDMFANGLGNGDDFRTAGLGGHLRLGGLTLAVDGSMLTDREAGTRSDEVLAVVGLAFGRGRATTGWHAGGFVGGGVRVDGDLGGEEVQNLVHRTIQADEVHLPYDGDEEVRPALTGSAVAGWLGQAGLGLTGWWGGQLVAAGQYAVDGEAILEAGPRLCLVGQQGAVWAGVRYRWRDGDPASLTAAATGRHEDGTWLDLGTFVVPFGQGEGAWGYQLRSGLNIETRAAFGSLGLVVAPGVSPPARELALEHDLAVYGGGAFGIQLRWHPWPYQDTGRRSAAVLDYRFGTEPDGRLHLDTGTGSAPLGADLRHDQITVGWEEAVRSPAWSGLRFVPWLQAGVGARQEGIVAEGDKARFTTDRASTAVVRGAFGVRLVMGERLSLGGSLDGWLPFWSEEVQAGADTVTLNDPGWAVGLHIAAHISW